VDSLAATGHAVAPTFEYVTGGRGRDEEISGVDLIVIEGLWPFFSGKLASRVCLKVYIDAAPEVRLIRRLRRDVLGISRGYGLDATLLYYERCSRPMERQFVLPGRAVADVVLDGETPVSQNLDVVEDAIRARLLV